MPELPEVLRFKHRLEKLLLGNIITSIKILQGPYLYSDKRVGYGKFRNEIENFVSSKVIQITTKGKLLRLTLEEVSEDSKKRYLYIHHMLAGSWSTKKSSHSILEFKYENEEKNFVILFFQDSMRIGTFKIIYEDDIGTKNDPFEKIGPEARGIPRETFMEIFRSKKAKKQRLCEALLDQQLICGIGNYLRAEIMYFAKLHPKIIIGKLTEDELKILHNAIVTIIEESIESEATTCGHYDDSIHTGSYEPVIYGKSMCPKKTIIETFNDKHKRTVHYAPAIQILPSIGESNLTNESKILSCVKEDKKIMKRKRKILEDVDDESSSAKLTQGSSSSSKRILDSPGKRIMGEKKSIMASRKSIL